MIENSTEHSPFYVHEKHAYVPSMIWKVTKRLRISQELGRFQMTETHFQQAYTKKRKGIFWEIKEWRWHPVTKYSSLNVSVHHCAPS